MCFVGRGDFVGRRMCFMEEGSAFSRGKGAFCGEGCLLW